MQCDCTRWPNPPAAPLLLGTLRFERCVLPLRPRFVLSLRLRITFPLRPCRPAELELNHELEAEEHEVFYTDDFAMHDVAAGGQMAVVCR